MSSPWDEFQRADTAPATTPAPAPRGNGGVYRIPDPRGDAREGRDLESTGNDATRTGIAVRGEGRDIQREDFGRQDTVLQRFNGDPRVQSYRNSIGVFASMLDAPANAQGDLLLVNAYAKVMDPNSVVREGEAASVQNTQAAVEAQIENIKRQFGMDESGLFSNEARRRLIAATSQRVAPLNEQYNLAREQYGNIARSAGVDPELVLGQHDAAPFRDRYNQWREQNFPDATRQDDPIGGPTRVTVANQGEGDDPTAGFRMTQGGESEFLGFLRRNAGRLTPDAINAEAARLGAGGVANAQEIADALNAGEPVNFAVDYSAVDAAKRAELESRAQLSGLRDQGGGGFGQSVDSFVRGAADTASLGFADEIAAAGDTIFNGGTMDDNLDYQRYVDSRDSENNGVARVGGQITGALLLPTRVPGAGVRAGTTALRAGEGMTAARSAARTATVQRAAGEGAGFGGAYGFGSSDGDITDRLVSGGTGALVGGGTGAGITLLAPIAGNAASRVIDDFPVVGTNARAARAADPRAADRSNFAEAALRNPEVPVMRADVPGSTGSQIATALADRTAFGGRVTRARDAGAEALGNQVDNVANRFGAVGDNAAAGDAAREGAQEFVATSQTRVGRLYDAIPIDGAADAVLDSTRSAFSDIDSRFASNPELQAAMRDSRLSRWQQALANGGLSWDDLKAFRTSIGETIEGPVLSEGTSRQSMRRLYSALSDDMEATARAQGPRALGAFRQANRAAQERFDAIDNVITPILGRDGQRGGEAVFNRLQAWANERTGDHVRLGRFMRSIPEENANAVRASMISRLGEAAPGQQNATGGLFSPNTFLTNWNRLSDRAKAVLFDGEHRQALDDLATLASGMREGRRFSNASESSRATIATASIGTAGASVLAGPGAMILASGNLAGQYGLSRMMASPRSARWLAALVKKPNPAAQRAHIQRLTALARSEPAIATDILGLQTRLLEAFGQPQRLAADGTSQGGEGVDQPAPNVIPNAGGN
ncbi:MAG: hypothetical protein V4696_07455 [Pseudomonadota bacterium]